MIRICTKSLITLIVTFFGLIVNGQNTLPSCVITAPHCNAYFKQGTDVTIGVYATGLGGTYTGGTIKKVEFYKDDTKLGEAATSTSNTYLYVWTNMPSGTYRITAKATDNNNNVFTSSGVIISSGSEAVVSAGISTNKGKYLANINGYNRSDYTNYWNGVTAENSCKWGIVEGTRGVMNWSNADKAYNFARDNHLSFRYHVLAWGSQYPTWIKTLNPADFKAEMEELMAAAAARFPLIDQVDVLNENMSVNSYNNQEHAEGTPYFRAGLGGPGKTGYDWAIWLFERARFYFPNARLVMNDFELETNMAGLAEMLDVIKVLRDKGLIDGIGTQAHYFNIDGISAPTLQNALNSMAKSGVPIYVTELDLKGKASSETNQLTSYQTLFPVYWNHPAVAGITLWGYVEGSTWSAGTGLLNNDGTERLAMIWLKSFMKGLPDVGYPFSNGGGTGITGINQFEEYQSIFVYPNPVTSGKFTIATGSAENINSIEVIDMQGRIVNASKPISPNIEIEVSNLKKGIYNVRVTTKKSVLSKKIIIL